MSRITVCRILDILDLNDDFPRLAFQVIGDSIFKISLSIGIQID